MTQRTSFYPLRGGLDLITPAVEVPPGRAIGGANYEPLERGYGRIKGYERIDGRTKASAAVYYTLAFDAGLTAVATGDTVTGATSGATGTAIVGMLVASGSLSLGTAAGRLVLGEVSGTFIDNEDLQVSAATVAISAGDPELNGGLDDAENDAWTLAAANLARTLIEAVPGSGPVRGVWAFGGDKIAIRDNAGGTAGVIYKTSAAGWVVALAEAGSELSFDAGTTVFTAGETVTGGTSGATAVIRRVIVDSGGWDTNDAAGRLIVGAVTGGPFQDDEALTSAAGAATADGAETAIALPPGGRYEFETYNFAGLAERRAMYFCNGVGRAFEFDGDTLVPIRTGLSDALDKPVRIVAHRNHLFLAFPGGSLQFSGIGDPYSWTIVQGAGEIGLGENITGLLSVVDGVLVVTGPSRIAVLYGSSSANFELRHLSDDSGAAAYSLQRMGYPLYLDDRGIRSLDQTETFGNFVRGTATRPIEPLVRGLLQAGRTPAASVRIRAKDQYRLFWDDGTALAIYLGRDAPECMTLDFGDLVPRCACSTKDQAEREVILVGADDGWVYEMESGNSFDGEDITAFLRLPFNHVGHPTQRKRWHKATLEIDSGPTLDLKVVSEVSYGDPLQPGGVEQNFSVSGGGGFWNEIFWNDFFWSTQVEGQADVWIDREGLNLSLVAYSSSAVEPTHLIHGLTLHYTFRGLKR